MIQDSMFSQADLARLSVQDFSQRFRQDVIPLNNTFAYFSATPLGEEDVKEYLEEPVAALPPAVQSVFSKVFVFLAPYLERPRGKGGEVVTFTQPEEKDRIWSAQFTAGPEAVLVLATKDRPVAEYHYLFYHALSVLLADRLESEALDRFASLLKEELRARVHGEIDEEGWNLKQALFERQADPRRDTKLFRSYARQSAIDTLTLYMHGVCCDIDIETGPRQLPSRYLRKRLQYWQETLPPPAGYAVFPDEIDSH